MLALLALVAVTTPAEHIAHGETLLVNLEYDAAALELMAAATDSAATDDERLRANLLAGIAHRVIGKDLDARMNFRYVLLRAPSTTLPEDTSPKVRFFFESVRQELAAERASPEPHPVPPPPQLAAPIATPPVAVPAPGLSTGVLVAGAGAAVLVVGGASAAISEAILATPLAPGTRDDTLLLGRISLVVAAVGVAAAALGGALVASGP